MRNKLLLTISILIMLMSCRKYDNPIEEEIPQVQGRTVLIYVAAENNLDYYFDLDIEEMKNGSIQLGDHQNLVIYVNRADTSSTPYLARVYNGDLIDKIPMPDAVAADPATLSLALSKTIELYPAESYGLVLWGHCSGWLISDQTWETRAYGGSTGDNTKLTVGKYWMNYPDMADAISAAMKGDKLNFIFGDCCNFVSIEAAYELRNVADYIIGSPAEIPDRGAPYDICIQDFFLDDTDFYRQLIDHYYYYWQDVYNRSDKFYFYYNISPGDLAGYSVPLVAIKSSELENLATATSNLLSTISDKVRRSGSLDLDSTLYYACYIRYRHSHDMNLVIKKNAAVQDYLEWKASFDKAVCYAVHSANWLSANRYLCLDMEDFVGISGSDCGSVSMFFPSSIYDSTSPNWNKAIGQFQWNNVIHWEQYGW